MAPGTDFAPAVDRWVNGLGRIRDVVRQRLVAAELADLLAARAGGAPLRVLDAGCGQGTQALALARAGHAVTGLDPSAELLDRFRTALAAERRALLAVIGTQDFAAGDAVEGDLTR
jgi:SAM-dependent methyltransferase